MARHKEFNPETALDQAMQLFWKQGYLATSISDLVDATGVQRYGLYGTFGSKDDLFLLALDRYLETVVNHNVAMLEEEEASWSAIDSFFKQFLAYLDTPLAQAGCLMCNSAAELGSENRAVSERMNRYISRLNNCFEKVLHQAQCEKELGPDLDPSRGARYLVTVTLGLFALSKTGLPRQMLIDYVDGSLNGFAASAGR